MQDKREQRGMTPCNNVFAALDSFAPPRRKKGKKKDVDDARQSERGASFDETLWDKQQCSLSVGNWADADEDEGVFFGAASSMQTNLGNSECSPAVRPSSDEIQCDAEGDVKPDEDEENGYNSAADCTDQGVDICDDAESLQRVTPISCKRDATETDHKQISKKAQKKKEMEDLNSILAEMGISHIESHTHSSVAGQEIRATETKAAAKKRRKQKEGTSNVKEAYVSDDIRPSEEASTFLDAATVKENLAMLKKKQAQGKGRSQPLACVAAEAEAKAKAKARAKKKNKSNYSQAR